METVERCFPVFMQEFAFCFCLFYSKSFLGNMKVFLIRLFISNNFFQTESSFIVLFFWL